MKKSPSLVLLADRIQTSIYELVRYYALCDRYCTEELSVTASQGYILLAMPDAGSVTMNDLSVTMRLANSTMTRMVDQLIHKGMMTREPDPLDRRVVRVRISEQGNAVKVQLKQTLQDLFTQVLQDIPEEERLNVMEGLDILNRSFERALKSCCGEEAAE